jgi:hypothetical protein
VAVETAQKVPRRRALQAVQQCNQAAAQPMTRNVP